MLNIYNQQNNHNGFNEEKKEPAVKASHPNAGNFEDVTGEFTASQFKWSFWFAKNKVFLRGASISILVLFTVLVWAYSLYGLGDYVINGYSADVKLHNSLTSFPDYSKVSLQYGAKPLEVGIINSFAGGGTTNNIYADINNPNDDFIVNFDYHFVVGVSSTSVQHGFLLANESRPIVVFGYGGSVDGANLVFDKIEWKRVSAHKIKNPIEWQANRINFVISDFAFSSVVGSDVSANQLTFKIQNNSAYGYKQANFIVGITQAGSLVAVMPLSLSDFKALETRTVDLRNYNSNVLGNDIVLYPMINIYDNSVYLPIDR